MRFEYIEDAKYALSLCMPLDQKRHGNMPCEKYFGGLLPESVDARKIIGRMFDANPNNTFALLRAIGADCAGAVSFHPPDDPVQSDEDHEIVVEPLSEQMLERHIRELPQKPLFAGVDGLRLSLAGVQEKAAICLIDSEICIPLNGTPTTHILKPAIKNYDASVQNEFLCLKTAERLGLKVPKVEIRRAGDELYLLVERYDRRFDEGRIHRLHQEDFCQAMGMREKYQRYGGPSHKDCFDLLFKSSQPAVDRNRLIQIAVFNFLIGNADAHGKNFAVLHDVHGKVKLAPFYDILCTQAYEQLTSDMCMKIGEHYNFNDVTADDWKLLSGQIDFSLPVIRKTAADMSDRITSELSEERKLLKKSEFDSNVLDTIVKQTQKNSKRLFDLISKK